MRRTLRMFACSAVAAGCFAASQAAAASAQSLQVNCGAGACTASGEFGRLSGMTVLNTHGDSYGYICVAGPPETFFSFPGCGTAFGELLFSPQQFLTGAAILGPAGTGLTIEPRALVVGVGLGNVVVDLVASNGDAGILKITPGSVQCVSLRGHLLVGNPCTPLL